MKISLRRVARISAYAILISTIIYISAILVAIGQGYRYDWKNGQLVGGGLVFIKSMPAGAQVVVDGTSRDESAPLRLHLDAGEHRIELKRAGFHPWQKDITVSSAGVNWLDYALLVPEHPQPTRMAKVNGAKSFEQSPNQERLALAVNGSTPHLELIEPNQNETKTIYRLPASLRAAGAKISALAWAPDSRHLLVSLQVAGNPRYLVVDANGSDAVIDIESRLKRQFSKPNFYFSPSSGQQLYWLEDKNLRRLDLERGETSKILGLGVVRLSIGRDDAYLLQRAGGLYQVMKVNSDGSLDTIIGGLEHSSYQLTEANYRDQRLLALLDSKSGLVSLYRSNTETQQSIGRFETVQAQKLWLSPNSRYLVMQDGANFSTFDFDLQKLSRFKLGFTPEADLTWFDSSHLLAQADGRLHVLDFDGTNVQPLGTLSQGLPAFSSPDLKWLYTIRSVGVNQYLSLTNLPESN